MRDIAAFIEHLNGALSATYVKIYLSWLKDEWRTLLKFSFVVKKKKKRYWMYFFFCFQPLSPLSPFISLYHATVLPSLNRLRAPSLSFMYPLSFYTYMYECENIYKVWTAPTTSFIHSQPQRNECTTRVSGHSFIMYINSC